MSRPPIASAPEPLPHLHLIAPPPVLYLGTLLLGLLLQALWPTPFFIDIALRLWGCGLLLVGAGLARWSFLTLKRAGTSGNPRTDSTALVKSGPFAFSRNPIYLAMTLLYLGLGLLLDAAWVLTLLPVLLGLMNWGVIQREETYLEARFGSGYRDYQRQVRRWF
jgi:protein-S-isoprenylcysteine O-methyltransferase Ste14